MARLARVELFAADEIAVAHVINRVVRRCFLLVDDAVTGASIPRLPTGSCRRWSLTSLVASPGRASIPAELGAATKASCPSRWRPTWSCWTGRGGSYAATSGAIPQCHLVWTQRSERIGASRRFVVA